MTIWVSIGDKVTMPDVTGMTRTKRAVDRDAGLTFSFADVQGCDKLGRSMQSIWPRRGRQLDPARRRSRAARHGGDDRGARAVSQDKETKMTR